MVSGREIDNVSKQPKTSQNMSWMISLHVHFKGLCWRFPRQTSKEQELKYFYPFRLKDTTIPSEVVSFKLFRFRDINLWFRRFNIIFAKEKCAFCLSKVILYIFFPTVTIFSPRKGVSRNLWSDNGEKLEDEQRKKGHHTFHFLTESITRLTVLRIT